MFSDCDKTDWAAKFVKSRIMTKVIDYVLLIGKFEQQCVVTKGMLQSPRFKYFVKNIDIEQLLRNNDLFEHKCIQNIKKL